MSARKFDLVVYNGSPAGIACAVRAAREGLSVLIVNHTPVLGGMLSNGLGVWDTHYEGKRAPIYDELRAALFEYYRDTYGEDSEQYRVALPGPDGHSNGQFEAKVFCKLAEELVARAGIEVLRMHYPVSAEKRDTIIQTVSFGQLDSEGLPKSDVKPRTIAADTFVDSSYEGDLMAVCGADYRYGREPREEFDEPHAGRIFVRPSKEPPNKRLAFLAEEHKKLDLRPWPGFQEIVETDTSGTGDDRVQAFNIRSSLTDDPDNQLPVLKPEGYDRDYIAGLEHPRATDYGPPNRKHRVNRPQLVGPHNVYIEGSWEDRKKVMDDHWNALLGSLYFDRNDPSISADQRSINGRFALARDELVENCRRPYEIYVRESRRLEGQYTLTEHDAAYVDEIARAPVHADGIAATEWYIDIHACSFDTLPGTLHEGKIMMFNDTFPGQVPYRAILPKDIDNLLVPLCVSTSHVAWSTVRLEPTWMNIGEAVGWATVLASRQGVAPGQIDSDALVKVLAENHVMVSFFNDVDLGKSDSWIPGVCYFATKGFFPGYDARPGDPLDEATAEIWAKACAEVGAGTIDPMETVKQLHAVDTGGAVATAQSFSELLDEAGIETKTHSGESDLTRGEACRIMFEAL